MFIAPACIEKYKAGTSVMEACHHWAHSADITNVPNGSKLEASGFRHETPVQSKMSAPVYDKRRCIKPLGVVNVEYLIRTSAATITSPLLHSVCC